MSADAWYVCPFCVKNYEKINELYGKIPFEEWKKLLKEKKPVHPDYDDQDETIRCDYEQWLDDDGVWHFKGGMHCALCGREWEADVKIKSNLELNEEQKHDK